MKRCSNFTRPLKRIKVSISLILIPPLLTPAKAILQADLIYLPDDNGFRFALVCVDISTGYTDAEPVKERDAETVLKAYKKITSREPLKNTPRYVLQTDGELSLKAFFIVMLLKRALPIG